MTKQFKHLQSIVNYRIPINEDGTLGNPQIINKWTKEIGAPKYKPKPKKKEAKKEDSRVEVSEVEF